MNSHLTGINYIKGDATNPQVEGPKIIAHICNDLGGWGRGFVLAISRRWKEPEANYRAWYRDYVDFKLGHVRLVPVGNDIWVCNMIAQHGIFKHGKVQPIRYEALDSCLEILNQLAEAKAASIHLPRIGCGLAGGSWEFVEPLILKNLADRQVYVYDIE